MSPSLSLSCLGDISESTVNGVSQGLFLLYSKEHDWSRQVSEPPSSREHHSCLPLLPPPDPTGDCDWRVAPIEEPAVLTGFWKLQKSHQEARVSYLASEPLGL